MDLENILRKKAAEREAERERQQREQKSLAETSEKAQKQQAEEARVAEIRESVTAVDARIGQIQALLTELGQTHAQAKESVAGAKAEGKELAKATGEIKKLFDNPEFATILADEEIYSIDDLLKAKDYAGHKQVVAVKDSRESRAAKKSSARERISARRKTKEKAHGIITAERPGSRQKLVYKEIVSTLQELVGELSQKRKDLYYQTPEGQAELKAEILERVKQRHEPHHSYSPLKSKQEIDNRGTVVAGDIQDAAKYGEAEIKVALKNYYVDVIDKALNEEAKSSGILRLREAVATIDSLPKQWREIQNNLHTLQRARQETIDQLETLLGKDKKAPLFQKINNYGNWRVDDPKQLAETFVDANSYYNTITLGLGMGAETPDEILGKTVSAQIKLAEQAREGSLKTALNWSGVDEQHQYGTGFEDPERAKIILAEQLKFYKKFLAALTTPEEVLAKMGGHNDRLHQEIQINSQYDLGLDDRGKINRHIQFDGKTYAALRDTNLDQIRIRLEQQQTLLEKTGAALKEQIGAKVEVDWVKSEFILFNQANWREYQKAEKTVRLKKSAEQLSPHLDLAVAQLSGHLDEKVTGHLERRRSTYHLEFDSAKNEDLMLMARNISELEKNIRDAISRIDSIEQRAGREGDGLLGGKKKKRDQEKFEEQNKIQKDQIDLDELKKEYRPKRELENNLAPIRGCLYDAQRAGIEIELPSGSVSFKELIDNIKSQLNFTLTPEESQLYERHQELEKRQAQKTKEYEQKYR